MNKDYDYLFKIIILGDSGVGKTAILNRFADDQFTEIYSTTVGIDFKIRTILIEGKKIKLQMWDTAGQERFRTLVASYYRGAHGTVLSYDVTNKNSFDNVRNWIREIDSHNTEGITKLILANKCDLPTREVHKEDGELLAKEMGIPHIEVSAKTGLGVQDAFNLLANSMYTRLKPILSQNRQSMNAEKLNFVKAAERSSTCC